MEDNRKKSDFDYTIVLDGDYLNTSGHEMIPEETADAQPEERDEFMEAMDRLYYDYERMCIRDPNVLDKDDMYPHTYHWRMGDRYDPGKKEVLEQALKLKKRVADTEAYQRYVEAVSSRKFKPDSWD